MKIKMMSFENSILLIRAPIFLRFVLEPLLPKKMHSRSQDKLDKDDLDKDKKEKKDKEKEQEDRERKSRKKL